MPEAATGAERAAVSGAYYGWEVPGKRVSISIAHEALDRIVVEGIRGLGLVPRRGAEVGGILLGTVAEAETVSVRIDDVQPIECEYASGPTFLLSERDRQAFRAAVAKHGAAAVGFYRTETGEKLVFRPQDLEFFSQFFPEPSRVALLLQPRAIRSSIAGFFIWEGGTVRETSHLQFRVQARGGRRAGARERRSRESQAEAPVTPARPASTDAAAPAATPPLSEAALPTFARVPAASRWRTLVPAWFSWWVQVPLVLLLVAADTFLGYAAAREFQAANVAAGNRRDPYRLGLVVLEYGDNLHLNWDRNCPAVASARRGVVTISDGPRSRVLELSKPQLRGGSIIYRRRTRQVRMRLDVHVNDRASVSESWEFNGPPPAESGNSAPVRRR